MWRTFLALVSSFSTHLNPLESVRICLKLAPAAGCLKVKMTAVVCVISSKRRARLLRQTCHQLVCCLSGLIAREPGSAAVAVVQGRQ